MVSLDLYVAALVVSAAFLIVFKQLLQLDKTISHLKSAIEDFDLDPPDISESIVDDITSTLAEMMGSMRTPTAFDHIGGALAGLIQSKAMANLGIDPSQLLAPEEDNV